MTDVPEAAWAEVGRRLHRRIFKEMRLTKAEFIRRSGISFKTLDGYLEGKPIVRADKARALADAVGWTPDSIDRIRRGEEPMEAAQAAVRPAEFSLADEVADLRRRLELVESELQAERNAH